MEPCKHEDTDGVAYTEAHAFDHCQPRFLSVAARIETPDDAIRLARWLMDAADWFATHDAMLAARERKDGE
jgi:hypothetical protein